MAADFQIIVSTYKYEPKAFTNRPYACTRYLMLSFGIISLLNSLVAYMLCLLVFGGLSQDPDMRFWVFCSFFLKAFTWSPFLAIEAYDTLFEQIYCEVQH